MSVFLVSSPTLWQALPYAETGVSWSALFHSLHRSFLSLLPWGAIFILPTALGKPSFNHPVFQLVQRLVQLSSIRVVGQSVGLPISLPSLTLIGGNLFGLVGMIFFCIFAVITAWLRSLLWRRRRLNEAAL